MDKRAFVLINVLRKIVSVFFETFFVVYLLNLVNFDIFPFVKFYFVVFITILASFLYLNLGNRLKYKVYYYRIGIALLGLFVALVVVFREKVVEHLCLLGFVKGLADGLYSYPQNVINSNKIAQDRKKYYNIMCNITHSCAIIVPLILGIVLSYVSYIDVSKVVFAIIMVIFMLSFYVKEDGLFDSKINLRRFYQKVKKDKSIQNALIMQFLEGFFVSNGILTFVLIIYKVLFYNSNLYVGILSCVFGLVVCLTSIIYAKRKKEKCFKTISAISLAIMSTFLVILGIMPNNTIFTIFLVIYAIGITLITLTADNVILNAGNNIYVRFHRDEYHLLLDSILELSKVVGYILLFCVGLTGKMELIKIVLFFSIIPLTMLVVYIINANDRDVKNR